MKLINRLTAALLGLVFVVFGLNFFLKFLPIPMPPEGSPAAMFMGGMFLSGMLAFVKVLEILGGVLMAIPATRNLGLVILGPIIVNIFAFHVFFFGPASLIDPMMIGIAVLTAWQVLAAGRSILSFLKILELIAMVTASLFEKIRIGAVELPNRIFMAPLTRCRAEAGHVPGPLMAEYYAQRASAGLIIAEATMAMEGNSAFYAEPGIYNEAQIAGWRGVTEAVHAKGGRIFLQIWHGGRACHPFFNNGAQPVAPSAIAITGDEVNTPEGKKPYAVPRELRDEELPGIVAGFKNAAANAKAAGFDGVEIHAANGYLLDEFLRNGANKRTGPYGGSLENRARLLLEVIAAVSEVFGSDRVGVRISPLNSYNSMSDTDPVGLATWLAKRLNECGLAYLHLMRADFFGQQHGDVVTPMREHFHGLLVLNMGFTPDEAAEAVSAKKADAAAFGTSFLANPDLPDRIRAGAPLNAPNPATFYTPGPEGYTDYPALDLGKGIAHA